VKCNVKCQSNFFDFAVALLVLGGLHVELEIVQSLTPERTNTALKPGFFAALVFQVSPDVALVLVRFKTFGTEIKAVMFHVI
jgi:hypothetical protein